MLAFVGFTFLFYFFYVNWSFLLEILVLVFSFILLEKVFLVVKCFHPITWFSDELEWFEKKKCFTCRTFFHKHTLHTHHDGNIPKLF